MDALPNNNPMLLIWMMYRPFAGAISWCYDYADDHSGFVAWVTGKVGDRLDDLSILFVKVRWALVRDKEARTQRWIVERTPDGR